MTNLTKIYLQEVLDKDRLDLLDFLIKIKEMGFILGGGTALALMFGHRESKDFDFFINQEIDTEKLFQKCFEIFKGFEVMKLFEEKNTLYILVNNAKISFFTYKPKNIGEIIETKYFNLFSLKDIASMKMWAIQNRATNKDYVDLYYIIQKIGIDELLDSFFAKFGNIVSKSYLLKSLIYFDDIKEDPLILKEKDLDFEKIKKYLKDVVNKYIKNN